MIKCHWYFIVKNVSLKRSSSSSSSPVAMPLLGRIAIDTRNSGIIEKYFQIVAFIPLFIEERGRKREKKGISILLKYSLGLKSSVPITSLLPASKPLYGSMPINSSELWHCESLRNPVNWKIKIWTDNIRPRNEVKRWLTEQKKTWSTPHKTRKPMESGDRFQGFRRVIREYGWFLGDYREDEGNSRRLLKRGNWELKRSTWDSVGILNHHFLLKKIFVILLSNKY